MHDCVREYIGRLPPPYREILRWKEIDGLTNEQIAARVVVIDGCHLRCHGRVVEHLVGPGRLAGFNARAQYRKYGDSFAIDAVPARERQAVARDVAGWVLDQLGRTGAPAAPVDASGGGGPPEPGCADSRCG